MKNTLIYKEYVGIFEYIPEDREFHGHVLGIRDMIHFSGSSVDELEKSFTEGVEDYLDMCREIGKTPQKPASGRFVLRVSPEVHRLAEVAARSLGKSLNAFAAEALEEKAREVARG